MARAAAILFVLAYIVWRFGADRSDSMHEFVGVTMGTTFKVTVDGRVLWDKQAEGRSPHIMEVKDIKATVANMVESGAVIQSS